MKPIHFFLDRILKLHEMRLKGKGRTFEALEMAFHANSKVHFLSEKDCRMLGNADRILGGQNEPMQPFYKSMSLLLKLHELGPDGAAGTDKGEAIRDQLDEIWNQMTDSEKEAWGEVSELLRIEAEQ